MKKIFMMAVMAMFAVASQAQIVSSRSTRVTNESSDYSYFYVQYNPSSFKPDGGDSKSFTGLSVGYNKAFSITESAPLFVEAGLGVQYSFYSEDFGSDGSYKFNMLSAKVPVSLAYAFNIPNTSIDIIPKAGVDFRFNILGKMKEEYGGESESINLFDKDDMGDNAWKRFQIGWHIGVDAKFNDKFLVGVSYGTDFSEIVEKAKINTASITVGLVF